MFNDTNLNPTGKKVGDCVVRAIAKATRQTWTKVYDDLCQIGREMYAMPNDKKVFAAYLDTIGWQKNKMPRFPDNTRYTLKEFADEYNSGTYIVSIAHHITCISNGVLFDTWNGGYKSVNNYWSN